jgi:hypothetical protein
LVSNDTNSRPIIVPQQECIPESPPLPAFSTLNITKSDRGTLWMVRERR